MAWNTSPTRPITTLGFVSFDLYGKLPYSIVSSVLNRNWFTRDSIMATQPNDRARLEFRLSREHKELIERAASAVGQTVSDFATSILVVRAQKALQEALETRLSHRDRDVFLAMLDDAEPNEALRKAAERYRHGG